MKWTIKQMGDDLFIAQGKEIMLIDYETTVTIKKEFISYTINGLRFKCEQWCEQNNKECIIQTVI